MDFNKIIERVKNILLTPKTTWPEIADEPATTAGIYKGYVLILAAIPAVFGFLKAVLIGYSLPFAGTVRVGFGWALSSSLLTYVLSIVGVFIAAAIVNALAPTFGGQKNSVQALKAVAYAFTASWVAGVGAIVPWLSVLIAIVGGIYSIYLLYLGLPPTMKSPQEKAGGYTAVVVIVAIIVGWVVNLTVVGIMGTGMYAGGAFNRSTDSASSSSEVDVDPNSSLGKLQKWGKQMEQAGKNMEAAQKSGDTKAQGEAVGSLLGAALGGGGGKVESLPPDRIKAVLPDSLAGMPRKSIEAERNSALGIQVSRSEAQYGADDGSTMRVEIMDVGTAQGLMLLAGWTNLESDKESESGFEKTYRKDGRLVHEQWDKVSQTGKYSVVLGERFIAEVSGKASSLDQLKEALSGLDLAALESMKDEGRKPE